MKYCEQETLQTYEDISNLFYDLTTQLQACHFSFCAYVVEEAYYFYSIELEKRFRNNVN